MGIINERDDFLGEATPKQMQQQRQRENEQRAVASGER
jgi:hypothetical protein